MDIFDHQYYKLHRILLSAIGSWPYMSTRDKVLRQTIIVVILGIQCLTVGIDFLFSEWTIELFAEIAPIFILFDIAFLKYFFAWFQIEKVQHLLDCIKEHWKSPKSEEEQTIIEEYAERAMKYNFIGAGITLGSLIAFCSSPFSAKLLDIVHPLNESRPLHHLYRSNYFVDPQKHFYPILLHMYASTVIIITILFSHDFLYIMKIQHACSLFHVAGYHLNRALNHHARAISPYGKSRADETIPDGVVRHQTAMEYIANINDCYGWSNFFSIILIILSLSVTLYCAVAFLDRWTEMMKNLVCACGQVTLVFMVNYPAQQLIEESTGILYTIYSSKWYAAPTTIQKLMMFIMQKSLTPTPIVVGKKYPLSLEAYGTMIQTSVSYFMTLFSLR